MAVGALTQALADLNVDCPLEPLGDRIIVLRDPKQEMIGSIVVADVAQSETDTGVVVAVGDVKRLTVGDRVVFGVHSGDKLPDEFQADPKHPRLVTMREEEVWSRVK